MTTIICPHCQEKFDYAGKKAPIDIVKRIIFYLNKKTGSNYRHNTNKTISLISARLNEGFKVEDFKTVIDNKCRDWLNDPNWTHYLRPDTLFSNKFDGYLNQKQSKSSQSNLYKEWQPDKVDVVSNYEVKKNIKKLRDAING